MTVTAAIQGAASGENMTGHVVSAAALGGGFSAFVVWVLQTWVHVAPPDDVGQWFTAVGIVAASWLLQKIAS